MCSSSFAIVVFSKRNMGVKFVSLIPLAFWVVSLQVGIPYLLTLNLFKRVGVFYWN